MKEIIEKRAVQIVKELGLCSCKVSDIIENTDAVYVAPDITLDTMKNAVDHTVLSFNATESDVLRICDEAFKYSFKAICINPVWVKTAFEHRSKNKGKYLIATVVDFPLGASTMQARVAETKQALNDGADEIDLVISIGMLKSGRLRDTYEMVKTVALCGGYLKVILETSELTLEEKIDGAIISVLAGADMLKTSTGVNGKAAIEDVKLLRMIAGSKLGVKAAGGIRDKKTLIEMMTAGADRIGCSSSVNIVSNW
ncbi:MAG TPA: deoxyribose-phosphate aldolase [bacterium]|nr:deoxyribose-phosphate aldolase [bacterium]HPS29270.1 deoxyribose-phosphate aldolase [bacterium]